MLDLVALCNGSLCNPYGELCDANADLCTEHSISTEQFIRIAPDCGVCRATASEAADQPELVVQESRPRYLQSQPIAGCWHLYALPTRKPCLPASWCKDALQLCHAQPPEERLSRSVYIHLCWLAVPFTPTQGICTPSPTNMAAYWYQAHYGFFDPFAMCASPWSPVSIIRHYH